MPSSDESVTTRVLVTGVRGKTGAPLAALLVARGIEVLGGSSDPSTVALAGVRPTAFDWGDPDGWAPAAAGVDAVFLVRPDREDAPALVRALLEVLPSDVRVVLLSERSADHPALEGWALGSERAVQDSGHPWAILRPGWFLQVLTDPRFYRDSLAEEGSLPFAGGGAALAWIDARDIAAVAEQALLDPDLDGRVLELTGPEALTFAQTAARLSAALQQPVEHRELSVAEALDGLAGFDRHLLDVTLRRVHDGTFAPVTDTVQQVTGRPPRTLEAFVAEQGATLRRA